MPVDYLNSDTHTHGGLPSPRPLGFDDPTLRIICAVSAACANAADAFLSLS